MILLYVGRMNFDIYTLGKEYVDVKEAQVEHYSLLCDRYDEPENFLSCKLAKMIKKSSSRSLRPIRLWLNQSNEEYDFQDVRSNCSLTVFTPLDNCYPDCTYLSREVRNAFSSYLQSCPLSKQVCWPLFHHLVGFEHVENFSSLIKVYTKFDVHFLFEYVRYYYYTLYYYAYQFGDYCTRDVISALENKQLTFKELLSILKFALYTEPSLSPAIILKEFDKAVSIAEAQDEVQAVLSAITEEASSTHWLIPIIITSSDKKWIHKSTELNSKTLKHYFPVYWKYDL